MIGRVRESRNPKKVIRVTLMESYGEIGRVPVNLFITYLTLPIFIALSDLHYCIRVSSALLDGNLFCHSITDCYSIC